MIKRILLGIGGTPFTSEAISRAVELASLHEAKITAVTVVDPNRICKLGPVPPGASFYAKKMCDKRMEVTNNKLLTAISTLEKSCEQSKVAYEIAWETGNPFELMIEYARYHDLTVFGLRSIFEYQLVDEPEKATLQLISKGVRPILAVSNNFRSIRKVMIAYSGSMESAKAMRRFVQFKLWSDASLNIVHFGDGSSGVNSLLNDAAAYCRDHGYTVNTQMIPGKAGERLLSVAQEMNTDLIVMGNSIRSIWLRKMIGDTVLKTLTRADLPLFLSQ